MTFESITSSLLGASVFYYVAANTFYLVLLLTAVFSIRKHMKMKSVLEKFDRTTNFFAPPISIIAPAYNEEATIVESINSFLSLKYPEYEIVVVNDGSKDKTMERINEAFALEEAHLTMDQFANSDKIKGTYRSKIHPNLIVVDKTNGKKASAMNVGIDCCSYEIFCAVDSDSLLDDEALLKVALPFLEDPDKTIASGGTIRIANGAIINHGRVESVELPKNPLVLFQIIEYTRAFLCGRIGWNFFNATLVISGAFGLFSKKAVQRIGGYLEKSMGEDMELVVRLHKYYRREKIDYSIVFIPDPVCWTEGPSTLKVLENQRDRWQRGLADTLIRHKTMMFNPRYGTVGLMALPYFLVVELLGPIIEVISLSLLLYSYLHGTLDTSLMQMYFLCSVLYGALLSVAALAIEEVYFSKYGTIKQFVGLFVTSLLEVFGYRQITSYWRIVGIINYFKGSEAWGDMQKKGFKKAS